jgi:Uma2 family endonuclease
MSTPTRENEQTTTSGVAAQPLHMSYEEYLAWDYEGSLTEWVDGEVIIHMATTPKHQKVVDFLNRLLGLFVGVFRLGEVYSAPLAMRAVEGGNAREPDLLFLATEHLDRLTDSALHGPADLVVEVISDDSIVRDRDIKFYEYQQGGICEYWIIDPRPGRLRADFYVLDERGRYQPVPVGTDDMYHAAAIPGFWLYLPWLWQDTPDPLAALAEIIGPKRLIAALQHT